MKRRCWLIAAAAGVVLGGAGVAEANGLSPYVYFWPGIVTLTLVYAFPASVLAAFVERPFYSAAGIEERPLALSLRANLLSTIVGILLAPIGYPALYAIGPLWCAAAFGVSCAVEGCYLRRFAAALRWPRVIAGNAVSSGVLMVLPPVAMAIRLRYPEVARAVQPHLEVMAWVAFAASMAVFLAGFAWRVPTVAGAGVESGRAAGAGWADQEGTGRTIESGAAASYEVARDSW